MADENAEIVQPRGCENDIVIVVEPGPDLPRQRVEPRLVAELVDRLRFPRDVILESPREIPLSAIGASSLRNSATGISFQWRLEIFAPHEGPASSCGRYRAFRADDRFHVAECGRTIRAHGS